MTKKTDEPLTGDAKWRAERQAVSDRNDAAHARGRAERDARDEVVAGRRRAADKRELASLPKQPKRPKQPK